MDRQHRKRQTSCRASTNRLDLNVAGESTPTATVTSTPGSGSGSGSGGSQGSTPTSVSTTSAPVTVRTSNNVDSVTIGEGTLARDANGDPLNEVAVASVDAAGIPPVPPGTAIGFTLDCRPAGATFDPPVTLTYTLSEKEWEQIGDTATLQVMWYNPGTGEWQEVAAFVNAATRPVTAQVSHFSIYALTSSSATTPTAAQTNTAPGTSAPAAQETGAAAPAGESPHPTVLFAWVVVLACALIGAVYFLRKSR